MIDFLPALFAFLIYTGQPAPMGQLQRLPMNERAEFYDPRRESLNRMSPPKRDIFPGNKFVFARAKFTSRMDVNRSGGPWYTDYPDSDQNFPLRLSELTTIDIDPRHVVLNLTDEALSNYPFLYMIEVGSLEFQDDEIEPFRNYLLRGGFAMADDFWGEEEWASWKEQMERVFPPDEYPIVDIPLTHEIFHCVFDLKEVPQVPSIHLWMRTGLSYERFDGQQAHCRGIFDKQDRLMIVMMHNTDLGDGWEREGESPEYFKEFSAKKAYPMGINIVTYAMTH